MYKNTEWRQFEAVPGSCSGKRLDAMRIVLDDATRQINDHMTNKYKSLLRVYGLAELKPIQNKNET